MKHFPLFFFSAFLLVLTGCESVRTKVQERFTNPEYQAKVVTADQHKAYEAARAALNKMNYTFERGGPAQGKLAAVGPMDTSAAGRGTARQTWFDARLSPDLEGSGTRIEILFSELVEDDFNKRPGQGELTPLRDSPLYAVFFRYVDEALAAKP